MHVFLSHLFAGSWGLLLCSFFQGVEEGVCALSSKKESQRSSSSSSSWGLAGFT
jgi:hypothetical protein